MDGLYYAECKIDDKPRNYIPYWHKFDPNDKDNGVAFRIYADFVHSDGFISANLEDFGLNPPSHYLSYVELRELNVEEDGT